MPSAGHILIDPGAISLDAYAIAEGLTGDGIPAPSAYDRARNSHRSGIAWSKSAVRAIKNKIDHPRAVYLSEDQLVPHLGRWLASKFSPALLPGTIAELADAQIDSQHGQAAEHARQDIAQCDTKLRQHRAALEAGADPAIVTGWMAEVQAQRTLAETRLTKNLKPWCMTRVEIQSGRLAGNHDKNKDRRRYVANSLGEHRPRRWTHCAVTSSDTAIR